MKKAGSKFIGKFVKILNKSDKALRNTGPASSPAGPWNTIKLNRRKSSLGGLLAQGQNFNGNIVVNAALHAANNVKGGETRELAVNFQTSSSIP